MTMRDTSWFNNNDPCGYCGVAVGCDPDAEVNAQDFKGGGSTLLLRRKPKIVAHSNCDFWATDEHRAKIVGPKSSDLRWGRRHQSVMPELIDLATAEPVRLGTR